MSGHFRFCIGAVLFSAAVSGTPAFSNTLTDLLGFGSAEPAAPAPEQEECARNPGRSTMPGHHWAYHLDAHRKCWFQAEGAARPLKSPVLHHEAKRPIPIHKEDEAAVRTKKLRNARDQLLESVPTDAQAMAAAPQVVASASPGATPAATLVPRPPLISKPMVDQLEAEHGKQSPAEVPALAAHPVANDAGSSAMPLAAHDAVSITDANDVARDANEIPSEFIVTRAGLSLIALGLVVLVGSPLVMRWRNHRMIPNPQE
jgi:hypothetical protein